jgi:hypothetical protein
MRPSLRLSSVALATLAALAVKSPAPSPPVFQTRDSQARKASPFTIGDPLRGHRKGNRKKYP